MAELSRRTVIRSAAWATPTLILATAVPAAAASTPPAAAGNPAPTMPSLNPVYSGSPDGTLNVGDTVTLAPTITAGSAPTGPLVISFMLDKPAADQPGIIIYPTGGDWTFQPAGVQWVMTHPGLQPGESTTPGITIQRIGDGASGPRTVQLGLDSDQGGFTRSITVNLP